jgi:membrane-bound metal-dependent hydrolase YbcI (DUF457 family)
VRGATRRERFFAGVVFAVAAFLILTVVLRMFQIEGGWLLLPSPKSENALFVFLGLIGLPVFAYIVGKRVAQMAVGFHAQRTAVFVPKPPRDSRNIHAALDANRRKKMAQVVMGNAFHPDFGRRVRHAILAFEDAHHGSSRRLIRPLCPQFD